MDFKFAVLESAYTLTSAMRSGRHVARWKKPPILIHSKQYRCTDSRPRTLMTLIPLYHLSGRHNTFHSSYWKGRCYPNQADLLSQEALFCIEEAGTVQNSGFTSAQNDQRVDCWLHEAICDVDWAVCPSKCPDLISIPGHLSTIGIRHTYPPKGSPGARGAPKSRRELKLMQDIKRSDSHKVPSSADTDTTLTFRPLV